MKKILLMLILMTMLSISLLHGYVVVEGYFWKTDPAYGSPVTKHITTGVVYVKLVINPNVYMTIPVNITFNDFAQQSYYQLTSDHGWLTDAFLSEVTKLEVTYLAQNFTVDPYNQNGGHRVDFTVVVKNNGLWKPY